MGNLQAANFISLTAVMTSIVIASPFLYFFPMFPIAYTQPHYVVVVSVLPQ